MIDKFTLDYDIKQEYNFNDLYKNIYDDLFCDCEFKPEPIIVADVPYREVE